MRVLRTSRWHVPALKLRRAAWLLCTAIGLMSGCYKAALNTDPFADPNTSKPGNGNTASSALSVTASFRITAAVAGGSAAVLQVVTRDATGALLTGKIVTLKADKSATVSPAQGMTDANGMLLAQVDSAVAGEVQVAAFVDNLVVTADTFFVKPCATDHLAMNENLLVPPSRSTYVGSAAGDLDGDGAPDLVVVQSSNTLVTFLNDGTGTFRPGSAAGTSLDLFVNASGVKDLNGDGKADVLATARVNDPNAAFGLDPYTSYYAFFAGGGDGTVQAPVYKPIQDGNSWGEFILDDVNGDHFPDLIAGFGSDTNTVKILFNAGQGEFVATRAVTLITPTYSAQPAIADINADGWVDVLVGDTLAGAFSLFLGSGPGQFDAVQAVPTHPTMDANGVSSTAFAAYLAVGDVTGDGLADIVTPGWLLPRFDVYTQGPPGQFHWSATYPAVMYMTYPVLADINGDGHLDVIFGNTDLILFLNQGNGAFGPAVHIPINGDSATKPVVADFNGDGALDAAVQAENEIAVVINSCR